MSDAPALQNYLNLYSKTSTFVSIDVVGSTALKAGENEQDVIYTFRAYHKLVTELAYTCHGEVINITGDGMMCRFERPEDAAQLAVQLLSSLVDFNKKQNHLTRPLALRVGVHTGQVLEGQGMASGQIISKTIDLAAKLQQAAPTNHARFSEETVALIKNMQLPLRKVGWDAAFQINIFELSPTAPGAPAARHLPEPVRVLLVEQELDEVMKLRKALFTRHHESLAVYTTTQAALAAQVWQPHLIVTSTDLPWEAGWEFLQTLRADARFSGVPILAVSSQTSGQSIERVFAKGGNGFLKKPLEEAQILKRVEMALREFYL
jgi:class 3 adenylate cyclase